MKKTILFEPELLAEVKRESPAVYENYCQTPFSKIEFADYGTVNIRMYMPTVILHMYKITSHTSKQNSGDELMATFQAGWLYGFTDLFLKDDVSIKDPIGRELIMVRLMMAAVAYPYYSLTTLIKESNFWKRGNVIYNTITYQEAQCFEAWKMILPCHQEFNDHFVALRADAKNVTVPAFRGLIINQPEFKPGLPLDEKDSPIDFSSFQGSNNNCGR